MNRRLLGMTSIAALVAVAACSDSTSSDSLLSEQEITADLAAASGEAIATEIADLVGNEAFAGFPAVMSHPTAIEVVRARTCFDQLGAEQTACDATTTASVVLTVTRNGSTSRSHEGPRGTEQLTAAVHQARTLTISGLAGDETSRTHDGDGTSRDTVTIVRTGEDVTITRRIAVASDDTVDAIVFNLPHSSNPWPVSGAVIRNASGTLDITAVGPNGERTESRSWTRRVQVTFPADAQGNVAIQINDQTCNLNLVTRRITNCS